MSTNLHAALDRMSADDNVGMSEVVAVFVAKYEEGLMAKKAELSAVVKQTKLDLSNMEKDLIASIDKSVYEGSMPTLGIKAVVGEVKVYWEKGYYNPAGAIGVSIELQDTTITNDKTLTSVNRYVNIDASVIADRKNLQDKLTEKNDELLGVMDQLKAVSRKERQIRGRIAEMKLENSGLSALVNEPELLKLVQM